MNNKTNLSLIAEFQSQLHVFRKFAFRLCKREEVVDDLIQNVFVKLLTKDIDFEIENNQSFLFKMLFRANQNHWKVNKKYFLVGDVGIGVADFDENMFMDTLMQRECGCAFQEEIEYSFKLKSIRKEVQFLPQGQQHAINQALAGKTVGEELGNDPSLVPQYESLKTNKRLAIQKLKFKLA